MEESKNERAEQKNLKSCSASHSSSITPEEEIVETHELQVDFSSPTPAKTREPSRTQGKEELVQLSEKYRTLWDFFNHMTNSLRLLRLCKREPTFPNISSQVEIMTGRKFLTMHLAQLKYILPEAIQIDKTLIHDKQTKCMGPVMKIELLFDVVEGHGEESVFVALSSLLSSRLKEFRNAHPEDCDVPQAVLPEPFNQKTVKIKEEPIPKDLSSSSEAEILNPSHFSPSFTRRFHQKAVATETEKTCLTSHTKSVKIKEEPIPKDLSSSSEAEILNPSHFSPSFTRRFHQKAVATETEKTCLTSHTKSACVDNLVDEKPKKTLPNPDSSFEEAVKSESTPMKLPSGSESVLVETPVQSTPVRPISPNTSVLSCEDDENKSTLSRNCKQSTSAVKKSLDFMGMGGKDINTISYKQESVSLSDLVPLIHQIFRSANFCPVTKEELVHKIIMFNCDFDDRTEVETQMEHLEKLVPDWFFKKLAPSGDLLYNVKKASDLNSVREELMSCDQR